MVIDSFQPILALIGLRSSCQASSTFTQSTAAYTYIQHTYIIDTYMHIDHVQNGKYSPVHQVKPGSCITVLSLNQFNSAPDGVQGGLVGRMGDSPAYRARPGRNCVRVRVRLFTVRRAGFPLPGIIPTPGEPANKQPQPVANEPQPVLPYLQSKPWPAGLFRLSQEGPERYGVPLRSA